MTLGQFRLWSAQGLGSFLLATVATAVGLVALGIGVARAAQAALDPPDKADLASANGVLLRVTPCSPGKHSEFSFAFTTPDTVQEVNLQCPYLLHDEMKRAVGSPISALYRVNYGDVFAAQVDVFELKVSGVALWTYQHSADTLRERRALLVALSCAAALCGVAMARLGLSKLRRLLRTRNA